MERARVLVVGGRPPRYLNDRGKPFPVDRGRVHLPPGSLAEGVVSLKGRIRIQNRVFLPPARWSWLRHAGPFLQFLRHLPPENGPGVVNLFWERWPRIQTPEEFRDLWLALLENLGTSLPPCSRCGGSMSRGGDPISWKCMNCGGKGSPFDVIFAFVDRSFGVDLTGRRRVQES